MNAVKLSVILAGFTLAAAPAFAQKHDPMTKMDTDQDGAVSRAEFDTFHEGVFAAADTDENGMTLEELLLVRMGPGPNKENGDLARQAKMQEKAKARKTKKFQKMDADQNDTVTQEEFKQFTDMMFAKIDADASETLSKEEFRQHHSQK